MDIKLQTNTSRSELILNHPQPEHDRSDDVGLKMSQKRQSKKQDLRKLSKKSQSITNQNESEQQVQNNSSSSLMKKSKWRVRMSGICLLIFLFGMMWAYGFNSDINTGYYNAANGDYQLVGITLLMSLVFVVIGFGLLLAYYGESLFSAFVAATYVVSITLIFSPLVQKLCFNVFNSSTSNPNQGNLLLFSNIQGVIISVNYSNMKLSISCAISQLLLYLSVIGRMQIYKTIFSSFIFIITWNINYFLCSNLLTQSPDSRFYDDYSISMVYLFAGCNALLISLDVPSNLKLITAKHKQTNYPKIISFLGVFFLWLSFCFTHAIVGIKQPIITTLKYPFRTVFYPEGAIGIFFTLSASTISTAAFSVLLHKHKKHFSFGDFILGSVSGAVMFGPVASFANNIGISIAVGIGSGLISVIYRSRILPSLNKRHIYDSLGLFGPILMVSILGTIVVAPIVIFCNYYYELVPNGFDGVKIDNSGVAGWVLIYAGISAGIGLISGMINSTILRCLDAVQTRFGDRLLLLQQLSMAQDELDQQFTVNEEREEEEESFHKKQQRPLK